MTSVIGRAWRTAAPSQRLGLGAFVLICVGLLALSAALARRPHFSVLYANLQQEDAAEVVKRLRELKVAYRVSPGGTIEAPDERVDELRLDLAGAALPAGGQSGFELFDRTRIGLSDFGEQLNYQRALQGELARTIAHLDAVEQARVHISLPRERLYESEEEKPTASVVLKLRGGGRLTAAQVASIVHLVSGAVGGLAPESVTVLDTGGRLLSNPGDSEMRALGMAAASSQLQLRLEYERQVAQAVQSMLDGVLGPGKAMVRASAELDFERVETEKETFQPAEGGNGVLQTRRETKEIYQGLAEGRAIGVPGISSNTVAPPAAAKGQPRADQYERSEVASDYRVSRQVDRTVRPPGSLKRLSVAVFLDEKAKVGKPADLRAAVAAAAGLDPSRGDSAVISLAPFEAPAAEEKGSKAFAIRDFYFRVGRDFAAIVLAVIFLKFAGGLLRRRAAEPVFAPTPVTIARAPQREPPPSVGPETAFDPDRAAAVLRGWLSAEQGPGETA